MPGGTWQFGQLFHQFEHELDLQGTVLTTGTCRAYGQRRSTAIAGSSLTRELLTRKAGLDAVGSDQCRWPAYAVRHQIKPYGEIGPSVPFADKKAYPQNVCSADFPAVVRVSFR